MRRLLETVTVIGWVFLAPKSALADDGAEPLPVSPAQTAVVAVPVATAPGGRPDAVYLRSGGMVRGRVHEIIPGHHVTATLEATGEVRIIPWAEIDRVVLGDATALPPPPGASILASSAPSAPAPMAGPRAHVHISTPKTVQLFRRPAGTTGWTNACASPCDIDLPLGDDYRVTGSGVAQSKEFRLQGAPGERLEIVVDPTSASGMVAGGLVAGTGAFAMYIGFLTTLVGVAQTNRSCSSYYYSTTSQCLRDNRDGPAVRNVGLGILLAGTAAAVIGLVVVVNSAGTEVTQHGAAAHAPKDAFLREPVWRGVATTNEAGTMVFPLLNRSF